MAKQRLRENSAQWWSARSQTQLQVSPSTLLSSSLLCLLKGGQNRIRKGKENLQTDEELSKST
jgi:hypothetical protein